MKESAVIHRIKKGLAESLSISEIARREGVDRKTVSRYRDMDDEMIRQARRELRRPPRKIDQFESWLRNRVREYEEDGVVNCESIFRELRRDGYEGSARSVRRYVAPMRKKKGKRICEPFETPIGHQAMVDLGEVRRLPMLCGSRTMYLAVMVLSWSRKKYGEWYERPITTEMFLEFHGRAFESFGGVPAEMVYDQTKLVVLRERYGECDFNDDFYAAARFYHFEPFICNKRDPQSKGKIESVMRYAKRGFLPGRSFVDPWDVQVQWEDWVENVADAKEHETTGRPPKEMWLEEKGFLKPLPEGLYEPQPSMEKRKVLTNGLVKILGNAYSAPARYHGGQVLVRVTEEKVEFYDLSRQHIYSHWRGEGRGKRFVEKSHYEKEYSVPTEALEIEALEIYGNRALLDALKARFPRHYREQLRGLIRLKADHAVESLQEAAERAIAFACASLGNIEKILKGVEENKKGMPPLKVRGGGALGVRNAQARGMDYYAKAAQERQEEQDEQAAI